MGIFDHLQNEIEDRDKRDGITLAELLDLSPPLRRLMKRITRVGEMTVEQASENLELPAEQVDEMLFSLVKKGYLQREERDNIWYYSTRFAKKRGRALPPGIWSALGERTKE